MSESFRPDGYNAVSPYLVDEDKRGGVRDAGGATWWIATKVE